MALRFDPRTGQFVDDGQAWNPGGPLAPSANYWSQPGVPNAAGRPWTPPQTPQYPQLSPIPMPVYGDKTPPPYTPPQPAYGGDVWASKMGQAQHNYSDDTWREQTQSKYDQYAASSPLSPTGTPLTPPSASPVAGPSSADPWAMRMAEEESRAKFASDRDRTQSKYNTVKSLFGPGQ